ncbi:MAG: nicotinate-nucleotide--dimethylbenzimidazole phosphoribosyltransferase, partial [Clostridia bacterium]|nr:nicotinate-nucleotide--dimethylbenzimidazole phosphoribosyltransferase [Clostridia bacterium]
SHASRELGYVLAARALDLSPLLALDMRLGEGSGCPLAFQLMRAACAVMNDMATFDEARIDDKYLDEIRKQADPGSKFGGI